MVRSNAGCSWLANWLQAGNGGSLPPRASIIEERKMTKAIIMEAELNIALQSLESLTKNPDFTEKSIKILEASDLDAKKAAEVMSHCFSSTIR